MEARQEIHVLPWIGELENEYGNVVDGWDAVPRRRRVYGWGPAGTNESTASRQTVVSDLELFAPPGFTLDPRDHVRIDGQTYEVMGTVEDFTRGPFGFRPGVRVNLRRFG